MIASSTKASLQEIVRKSAQGCGFHLSGIAPIGLPEDSEDSEDSEDVDTQIPQSFPELAYFPQWIAEGRAGEMEYLKRKDADGNFLRASAAFPFPWARSVIVCAVNYNSDQPYSIDPTPAVDMKDAGWIARYAWSGSLPESSNGRQFAADGAMNGEDKSKAAVTLDKAAAGEPHPRLVATDYHHIIRQRLEQLGAALQAQLGEFQARCFVDTGPLVERVYAKYAGLGWQGKNTCLIHESLGSWLFLGVILTSLDLPRQDRAQPLPDRCGSCTRCIDACPTQALEPYRMDASRCIAYLTIEKRGTISEHLAAKVGRNVFGCDICQEVCPWNTWNNRASRANRRAPITDWPELQPRNELVNPALEWLAALNADGYRAMFRGSPVERARFADFQRNVANASLSTKEES